MEQVFGRVVDRLNVPTLRRLFGAKQRQHCTGSSELSLQLATVVETSRYDLTLFKVHFGNLTLNAYTKSEQVLRFEAITHNTRQLRYGRVLQKFLDIITPPPHPNG